MEKSCEIEGDFMGRDEPRTTYETMAFNRQIFISVICILWREDTCALYSAGYRDSTLARKLYRRLSMIGTATLLSKDFVRPSG